MECVAVCTLAVVATNPFKFGNSEILNFLVVGLLLGLVASRPARIASAAVPLGTRLNHLTWPRLGWVVLGVSLLFMAAVNVIVAFCAAVSGNLAARGVVAGKVTDRGVLITEARPEFLADLRAGHLTAAWQMVKQSTAEREADLNRPGNILHELRELSALPLAEKRKTLLYIPRSNHAFWTLLQQPEWSRKLSAPYVATALTGIAMIDGLPDLGAEVREGFGLSYYSQPAAVQAQPPAAERRRELCARAAAWEFEKIIVLEADEQGVVSQTVWPCR